MCLDLKKLCNVRRASNLLLVLVKRLETAQKRLSDYKEASSGLNSNAQVMALSSNIDQLRAQLLVQEQQTRYSSEDYLPV